MADTQIRGLGSSPAPLPYTVPGAQEIILKTLYAEFDGTGAASPWLPCIRIRAPGGGVVGEFIAQSPVAAGSSADVSWSPFLVGAGSGIQFDTYPQSGDWLEVATTGVHTSGFVDRGGIHLSANGAASDFYIDAGRDFNLEAGNDANLDAAHDVNLTAANQGLFSVTNDLQLSGANVFTTSTVYSTGVSQSWRLFISGPASQVFMDGGILLIDARDQTAFGIEILVGAGSKCEWQDHNQNPIFRINEDGSLQGKTGKALTFNL